MNAREIADIDLLIDCAEQFLQEDRARIFDDPHESEHYSDEDRTAFEEKERRVFAARDLLHKLSTGETERIDLLDGDYTLTEGAGWFDVKGFAIRIHKTDEGVVVDVFNREADIASAAPIASTYAFDAETEADLTNPLCRCQNCGFECYEHELNEPKDLAERVFPGERVPNGECPSCGALSHEIEAGDEAAS